MVSHIATYGFGQLRPGDTKILCRPGMTISGSETSNKVVLATLEPLQSAHRASEDCYVTENLLQSEKGCGCHW